MESEHGTRYRLIAELEQLEHGKALMAELSERCDRLKRRAFEKGQISDDFRLDIRWLLGRIAGLEEVIGLSVELEARRNANKVGL